MDNQVLQTIEVVINKLAHKFVFGYYTLEDIKQEARIAALEALEAYDEKRPLEPFLYICVKRELCNLKRNNYERLNCPCTKCASYQEYECVKYDHSSLCDKYYKWNKQNKRRKNIVMPATLSEPSVNDYYAKRADYKQLFQKINEELPIKLRHDYLRLSSGEMLPKNKRIKVQQAVLDIMEKYGYNEEKTWSVEH